MHYCADIYKETRPCRQAFKRPEGIHCITVNSILSYNIWSQAGSGRAGKHQEFIKINTDCLWKRHKKSLWLSSEHRLRCPCRHSMAGSKASSLLLTAEGRLARSRSTDLRTWSFSMIPVSVSGYLSIGLGGVLNLLLSVPRNSVLVPRQPNFWPTRAYRGNWTIPKC